MFVADGKRQYAEALRAVRGGKEFFEDDVQPGSPRTSGLRRRMRSGTTGSNVYEPRDDPDHARVLKELGLDELTEQPPMSFTETVRSDKILQFTMVLALVILVALLCLLAKQFRFFRQVFYSRGP